MLCASTSLGSTSRTLETSGGPVPRKQTFHSSSGSTFKTGLMCGMSNLDGKSNVQLMTGCEVGTVEPTGQCQDGLGQAACAMVVDDIRRNCTLDVHHQVGVGAV